MNYENVGGKAPRTLESTGDLRIRTKDFARRIICLYSALPKETISQILGKQLLRSGTSVGAHFREGFRGRSKAEFIAKIELAVQELDESLYWMELLVDNKIVSQKKLSLLKKEADELIAILTTISKKTKC